MILGANFFSLTQSRNILLKQLSFHLTEKTQSIHLWTPIEYFSKDKQIGSVVGNIGTMKNLMGKMVDIGLLDQAAQQVCISNKKR